ncbi:pentatricopeptide repeat-containing protein At3g47530 [Salvia miltiorrhiza]|uniref:pentatricopeptide repeat-containing protein At3g47530 n=1 Tax=Salvia miltiorrhiza TaxID=226208 RepID=UPI0025AC94FA|nr:pentatricopeptide repeat-containing protein At3g47530 [Salvia miltiorrhiza]
MRIISLIKSCKHKSHLLQLHSLLLRSSHFYNPTVFLAFLSRLALPPLRELSYSRRVFSDFPEPNVSLYTTMIRAHSFSRDSARRGFQFYHELLRSGNSSNALSATAAVKCCTNTESLSGGMQVHARIWKDGCLSDSLLSTTLMDFYSCLEKGGDACNVFDEMLDRDVVAWNVLISCYTRNGRTRDALALFDQMRSSSACRPDDVTCLLVLQACGSLNSLEWGEKVHSYILEHGLIDARSVCNSLIAMYSRCGCVEKAYDVFKQMVRNRDVVSWTAMISGLASNGYGRDAIEAFKQMQEEGIQPGDQTFTSLLSACSHSGLVDEGRMFFQAMRRDFGVTPNVHHYGCMVDLLGRAGLLHEAYGLIRSMRIKPDAKMWRTLLGACRIHGDAALGEQLVEHLVELKAQEAGDYILLLNIYSSSGNSDKVMEVRKAMKEKGIQTTPASSTIELKGEVHVFFADDFSHPREKEIYEMLAEINQQLRIGGYVAEIASEMGSRSEPYVLSYHSEKLAIAFGILSTPPGTALRVAKDLRICVDCHSFCKLVSAVYNRRVVVRDRARFHHFQDGVCSCNDYW